MIEDKIKSSKSGVMNLVSSALYLLLYQIACGTELCVYCVLQIFSYLPAATGFASTSKIQIAQPVVDGSSLLPIVQLSFHVACHGQN